MRSTFTCYGGAPRWNSEICIRIGNKQPSMWRVAEIVDKHNFLADWLRNAQGEELNYEGWLRIDGSIVVQRLKKKKRR